LNEIVEFTADVIRRLLLEVQFGTVLELFHALGGLYTMLGSPFATGVADGIKLTVAVG
jgi:hypothetical protein